MAKPPKSLYMTVLMTPEMANFAGNVHGGTLLRLLDQVAYACAARYASCYVVTRSVDHVVFRAPVRVGELAHFRANVNYTGTTSMEVGVKVIAEVLTSGEERHVVSCYFTMVTMGEDGRPRPVPTLEPQTADDRKLFEAGALRKQMREEMAERNKALHVGMPPPGRESGQ